MLKILYHNPSIIFLILSNVFPLYMIYKLEWKLSDIIILYWAESGIIGFFTILKIIFSKSNGILSYIFKILFSLFFIFHFGGFMIIHALFLSLFFLGGFTKSLYIFDIFIAKIDSLLLGFFFLFISHMFSFLWNFFIKNEKEKTEFLKQMISPYDRILVMHVTILVGGFLISITHTNKTFLIIFVIMKILVDLKYHIKQHNLFSK
ncbi:MAG: DUF6498-containing protein [Elusimicrobiales bacterium]|nr:DUF6498-containing protein [Elusimicrobiales bacterium]